MITRLSLFAAFAAILAAAQTRTASVRVDFGQKTGTLDMSKMALGQGGLSPDLMWASRMPEVRALHPRVIRIFVDEYYDLYPARGKYDFTKLDPNVDLIRQTGATPLMIICFKPRLLYPKIDHDIVEPTDWAEWEQLVFNLVKHYKDRGTGIRYWEVANEPDIGEDGGTPYRFKPDSYVRYYQHTSAAVLRADPEARVGGPALASVRSPLLPALLESAGAGKVPLHFVSWHIYNSSPAEIRKTVEYARSMIAKHPSLKVETFLDEWNMSLSDPVKDPRFQPAFVLETVWHMIDAGLDYSCYYHIRDYYVDIEKFMEFTSPEGSAFMARWWNRMPQYDGLFDYQNTVRPAYYAFKLLSRMSGDRLRFESDDKLVRGFFVWDPVHRMNTLLVWNYSPDPVRLKVEGEGVPTRVLMRTEVLDANGPSSDENQRLRPLSHSRVEKGTLRTEVDLEPWGIGYWSFEATR